MSMIKMPFFRKAVSSDGPSLPERRRFFGAVGRFGFTAAVVGVGGGILFSEKAMAQTAQEERERANAAESTIVLATGYRIGATRAYPIMQLNFKENIQNFTGGRVYVRLAPAGELGTGDGLISKVQEGSVAIAQHSIANLAAFAPEVDLINIPYWSANNQKLINLLTSKAWADAVHHKVEERGFKVLSYICIDPRTVAVRRGLLNGPAKVPEDIRGIKFRVPGSQILQQVYRMLGANPTPVAWGETSSAMQQGVADALDPSVQALLVFGFTDVLASISTIQSVADAQVYTCNKVWFDSLTKPIQDGIMQAADTTFRENLAKVPAARAYAYSQMREAGVEIHSSTEDEIAQWRALCGHHLSGWNNTKIDLAGSLDNFDRLLQATEEYNGYFVESSS